MLSKQNPPNQETGSIDDNVDIWFLWIRGFICH